MKILLFGDASSANVQSFAKGLRSEGVALTVASFEPGQESRILPTSFSSRLRYLLGGRASRRLVDEVDPDVVLGYFASGYGTLARLGRGRCLAQVVAGSDVLAMRGRPVSRALTRKNLLAAHLVIAWSEQLGEEVVRWGVHRNRLLVRPRGVDLDVFKPGAEQLLVPALITTRALKAKYRHQVLLDALQSLEGDWRLTMIGDGPGRPTLQEQALHLGGRVSLPGSMDEAALANALRQHNIYVSTCLTDGVSASLLEAMATGLLPVVVDNAANRSWVDHGVNGLLHDGSQSGLRRALERAMEDEHLRTAARKQNRQLVQDRGDRHKNMAHIASALEAITR